MQEITQAQYDSTRASLIAKGKNPADVDRLLASRFVVGDGRQVVGQQQFIAAQNELIARGKDPQASERLLKSRFRVQRTKEENEVVENLTRQAREAVESPESNGFLNNSLATRLLRSTGGAALDAAGRLDGIFRTGLEAAASGDIGRGFNRIVLEEPTTGNQVLDAVGVDSQNSISPTTTNLAAEVLLSPANFLTGGGALLNKVRPLREAVEASPRLTQIANNLSKGVRTLDQGTDILGAGLRTAFARPTKAVASKLADAALDSAVTRQNELLAPSSNQELLRSIESGLDNDKLFSEIVKDRDLLNEAAKFTKSKTGITRGDLNKATVTRIRQNLDDRDDIVRRAVAAGAPVNKSTIQNNLQRQIDEIQLEPTVNTKKITKKLTKLKNQIDEDLPENFSLQQLAAYNKQLNKRFKPGALTDKNVVNEAARTAVKSTIEDAVFKGLGEDEAKLFSDLGQDTSKLIRASDNSIKQSLREGGLSNFTQLDAASFAINPVVGVAKSAGRQAGRGDFKLSNARRFQNLVDSALLNPTLRPSRIGTADDAGRSFTGDTFDRTLRNLLESADPDNNN